MRGNNWERMGMNGTKRDNMGVHGVINVLLWYYQIIKKISSRQAPSGAFLLGGDYANYRERTVVVKTICE